MMFFYLISLVSFLFTYGFIYILNHYTLQTKATITDVEKGLSDSDGTNYKITVQYTVDDNIIQSSELLNSRQTYKTGMKLMVLINPDNPKEFTFDNNVTLICKIVLSALFGLFFLYLTTIELIRIW